MVGRPLLDLIPVGHRAAITRREAQEPSLDHEEISVQGASGNLIPVEFSCTTMDYEGRPAIMMTLRDLSGRKHEEARMRHLAHHDALTNLPNRFLLHERLSLAMDRTSPSADPIAVLCLDLDHFKPVNDLLGHAAGDDLLIQVAKRLLAELRPTDTVARIGGDEFVIVVTIDRPDSVSSIAGRIIDALSQPFDLAAGRVEIGTSIGIALFPKDAETQDTLIRAADVALYRAKEEQRGTFRFFEADMDAHLQERRALEKDLRLSVERGQMQLHYQPIVNCATGKLGGFEALIRWYHPERGLIPPADFIPLAEETGQIVAIGKWVIETACEAAARWRRPYWVAVNLSSLQIRQSDLASCVANALTRSGLPASRLEIELTESAVMADVKRATDVLTALRQMGVRLALDDFGTGYSSLSYLRLFKFDKLKIDMSFITPLGEDADPTLIVRTIIGLAHNLGISVVAEGVETAQQLAVLRDFNCDEVQGYLLGRPMAMHGSTELVSARARSMFADSFVIGARPDRPDRLDLVRNVVPQDGPSNLSE